MTIPDQQFPVSLEGPGPSASRKVVAGSLVAFGALAAIGGVAVFFTLVNSVAVLGALGGVGLLSIVSGGAISLNGGPAGPIPQPTHQNGFEEVPAKESFAIKDAATDEDRALVTEQGTRAFVRRVARRKSFSESSGFPPRILKRRKSFSGSPFSFGPANPERGREGLELPFQVRQAVEALQRQAEAKEQSLREEQTRNALQERQTQLDRQSENLQASLAKLTDEIAEIESGVLAADSRLSGLNLQLQAKRVEQKTKKAALINGLQQQARMILNLAEGFFGQLPEAFFTDSKRKIQDQISKINQRQKILGAVDEAAIKEGLLAALNELEECLLTLEDLIEKYPLAFVFKKKSVQAVRKQREKFNEFKLEDPASRPEFQRLAEEVASLGLQKQETERQKASLRAALEKKKAEKALQEAGLKKIGLEKAELQRTIAQKSQEQQRQFLDLQEQQRARQEQEIQREKELAVRKAAQQKQAELLGIQRLQEAKTALMGKLETKKRIEQEAKRKSRDALSELFLILETIEKIALKIPSPPIKEAVLKAVRWLKQPMGQIKDGEKVEAQTAYDLSGWLWYYLIIMRKAKGTFSVPLRWAVDSLIGAYEPKVKKAASQSRQYAIAADTLDRIDDLEKKILSAGTIEEIEAIDLKTVFSEVETKATEEIQLNLIRGLIALKINEKIEQTKHKNPLAEAEKSFYCDGNRCDLVTLRLCALGSRQEEYPQLTHSILEAEFQAICREKPWEEPAF
ncbi:MAG: hypothetical protein WC371_05735 [Parachlamydiales bacterium]|jgi:hypothetical protein